MSSIKWIVALGRIHATVPFWWAALEVREFRDNRWAPHLSKPLCSETQGRSCSGWWATQQPLQIFPTICLTLYFPEKGQHLQTLQGESNCSSSQLLCGDAWWNKFLSLACLWFTVYMQFLKSGSCLILQVWESANTLPAWTGLVHSMQLHRS